MDKMYHCASYRTHKVTPKQEDMVEKTPTKPENPSTPKEAVTVTPKATTRARKNPARSSTLKGKNTESRVTRQSLRLKAAHELNA